MERQEASSQTFKKKKDRTSKTFTAIRVWVKKLKGAQSLTPYQSPMKQLGQIGRQPENFLHV
jgi:hypothetical protein